MITSAGLLLASGELATVGRDLVGRVEGLAAWLTHLATVNDDSTSWWEGERSDVFRSGNAELLDSAAPIIPAASEAIEAVGRLRVLADDVARELRHIERSNQEYTVLLVRLRHDVDRVWSSHQDELDTITTLAWLDQRRAAIGMRWLAEARVIVLSILSIVESLPSISTRPLGGPSTALTVLLGGGQAHTLGDAQGVADWWAALPPGTRAALLSTEPEAIGNLDGVPFHDRVVANRHAMQAALDGSEPGSKTWTELQQFVTSDDHGRIDPTRSFLLFDIEGDGRIAEVFGDLTAAGHIAVMVPGMGSTLAGFADLSARGRRLHATAGSGSAVIAWTGYDTPHGLSVSPGTFEVVSDDQAGVGGRRLHGFVDGLHIHTGGSITLIGHSYGSLTVGKALHAGTEVDRVVFMGSPGVDADQVGDFPEGAADEFFASEIKGDIVANLEHFGENPTDPDFGAMVFDSGDGDGLHPISRHGEYYDDGIAIENLASIVTGGTPTPGRTDVVEYVTEPLEDIDQAFNDSIDRVQEFDIPLIDDRFVDGPIDAVQALEQTLAQGGEIIIEEVGHFGQDVVESGIEWGIEQVGGWFR